MSKSGTKRSNAAAAAGGDSQLDQQFAVQSARFNTLASDCRLSFLEIKLYRKYFIDALPRTPEKLARLNLIIDTLEQHRANTIAVLKTIHEREQIVDAIYQQIDRINNAPNRNASILDFQSDGLHLIYLHQQVTLRVVEAVEAWRRPLTRPFPFQHEGENYFVKVLADCTDISASSLGKILPVKLAQYPLCSDLPSLCLFVTANPAAAAAASTSSQRGKQPMQMQQQQQGPTRMTSEMSAKIHSAQAILLEEIDTQKRLLRELEGLSSAGYFLPVLNLHSIIPSSATGIRMSNYEWEEQLRDAISVAKVELETAEDRVHHASPASHHHHHSATPGRAGGAGGAPSNKNAYEDDFDDDEDGNASRVSDSTASSPAQSPKKEEPPKKRVSIDDQQQRPQQQQQQPQPPRPSSALSTSSNAQPAPPPRPNSAKKRVDTPPAAAVAAAPAPAAEEEQPAPAAAAPQPEQPAAAAAPEKKDYDDDEFEKDDEL